METLRRAVRNTVLQLGSQAVTWGATLLLVAAMGRYLGDSGFGMLYLALAFTSFFGMLVDFGLRPLITRDVARRPELLSQYLLCGLVIQAGLWLISFAALQIMVVSLGYSAVMRQVLTIYTVTMGLGSVSGLLSAIFRGLERLGPAAVASILEKVFIMAFGIVVLTRGAGPVGIAWILLIGTALSVAWQALVLVRDVQWRVVPERGFVRRLVVAAMPIAMYGLVSSVYWRIDAVMLSKMTNESVVGWYGAAYRLFDTFMFLPNIVAYSVMMPVLSRLSRESRDDMKLAFEKGMIVLLLAGIPICAGLLVLARPILALIYSRPEFVQAAPVLQVLGVGVLVQYVNAGVGWTLLTLNLERKQLVIGAVAMLLNIALNLVMIPRWQHVGAAVATVICEIIIGAVFIALLPAWLRPRRCLTVAARAGLAAAGMSAAVLAAPDVPVLLRVVLGMAVYGALAWALRAVSHDDVALVWGAIGRRRAQPEPERLQPA